MQSSKGKFTSFQRKVNPLPFSTTTFTKKTKRTDLLPNGFYVGQIVYYNSCLTHTKTFGIVAHTNDSSAVWARWQDNRGVGVPDFTEGTHYGYMPTDEVFPYIDPDS